MVAVITVSFAVNAFLCKSISTIGLAKTMQPATTGTRAISTTFIVCFILVMKLSILSLTASFDNLGNITASIDAMKRAWTNSYSLVA